MLALSLAAYCRENCLNFDGLSGGTRTSKEDMRTVQVAMLGLRMNSTDAEVWRMERSSRVMADQLIISWGYVKLYN